MIQVLFDPQTSGGLLMAVTEENGREIERRMAAEGLACWQIGRVLEGSGVRVLP
jgi:selenide,water dikinase